MNDKLLLHPKTKTQLELFLKKPSHAVVIYGAEGTGKHFTAQSLASDLLGIPIDGLFSYSHYFLLEKPKDKQEISIDTVRQLIKSLSLKPSVSTNKPIKRVVNVRGAHFLSHEAQNALLKILEEPFSGTSFILSTTNESSLLPTIVSRSQKLMIAPISLNTAQSYFGNQYSEGQVEGAWQLSQGAAGLMSALLDNNKDHDLKKAVEQAKHLLRADKYQRLLMLEELSKDKNNLLLVLNAMNKVMSALHKVAISKQKLEQSKKLLKSRTLINQTIDSINKNASIRLACLNLAASLPL